MPWQLIGKVASCNVVSGLVGSGKTHLQIEMHLTLAFEQEFRFAAKPVTVEIIEQVLSRAIDDPEPTLTRNGYDAGSLASQLNAGPSDVCAFLAGTLDPS